MNVAQTQREREDKFDVDPTFVMPELTDLLPPGGSVDTATVRLRSTYFDTADHALLSHRVTLRRRAGDTDTGWQLKVPEGGARTEIRLGEDAGDVADGVPAELADLISGLAHGHPLHPVAILDVTRRAQRLLDPAGQLLAEVADDDVHASVPGPSATALRWREVEVELGPVENEKLLRKTGKWLIGAGAARSRTASKLTRALAGAETPHRTAKANGGAQRAARDVVTAYLSEQVQALSAGDLELRRGHDSIHATRVATRRLRSTLRVFAALFEPTAAAALDSELAWYAGLLGQVRDRQVARARFAAAVAATPSQLVLGPVAAQIEQTLLREQLHHDTVLHEQLTSGRYYALLETASSWAHAGPFTARADVDASRLVGDARKAQAKAVRRLAAALATTDPQHRAEALHRARKAVKRARYAAELAAPVSGAGAKKTVTRLKRAQEALGEHHDSIVAAGLLLRLGAAAGTTPDQNGFTYGLLYAHEQQATDRAAHAAAALRV